VISEKQGLPDDGRGSARASVLRREASTLHAGVGMSVQMIGFDADLHYVNKSPSPAMAAQPQPQLSVTATIASAGNANGGETVPQAMASSELAHPTLVSTKV
jgi:hypothetical protein